MEAQIDSSAALAHVPEPIREIIGRVKRDLKDFYGDRMQQLILFGSYARGDFHEESDIDLMPVLSWMEGSMWDEKSKLSGLAWRYFEESYTHISLLPTTTETYETSQKFLFRFIRKDGKIV